MPSGMRAETPEIKAPLESALPVVSLRPADVQGARATAMVFRSLGHPLRLQTIAYLHQHGPTKRSQLTSTLGETWSVMEHHLTSLVRDGFLIPDGQGVECVYRLADGLPQRLQELCG